MPLTTIRTVTSLDTLISGARRGDATSIGALLQHYRNYLTLLAASRLTPEIRPRVSPSDVVQETLLRAHKNFGQFRGLTEQELLAWLRQILVNNLATFIERHLSAERRDMRREVSLDRLGKSLEQSTIQLAHLLDAGDKSPSMQVQQQEEAVRLADKIAELPADYRTVLVLRNLRELPFEEIAAQLDRSTGATRMLWLRAIEKLREAYRTEGLNDA